MNRISRRNFLKAAGVGAAALGLAACGGSSSSTASSVASSTAASSAAAAADVTIKVAAIETGYGAEMWKKVAEAFTAQTGIKVDLTTDKKLEDVIGPSMQGGDYPDVVHLATGREAALTEQFIKGNLIADITDVLSMTVPGESKKVSEKIAGGFTDTSLTNPYGDGKTYLAPMFYSPCGLFYNAGFLKEKGWDVPKTWDEMWALGDKAAAEGTYLFTYPTTGYFDAFFYALMYAAGGPEFFNKADTNYAIFNCRENRERMVTLLHMLLAEADRSLDGCETVCQDLLEVLLIWLVRCTTISLQLEEAAPTENRECAEIKRYLDTNYREDISLDLLAELAHLNKYYLAHTFQREYGISPITYLNRRRIEESKHMLGNTGYSLAQISELMGFSSPSYFSQCFRKAEGLTPNEYRRQVRQGQRPAPSKRHEV
jgi:AraC-like DNA-binding protein